MLEVKMGISFEDLKNNCWGGAIDRLNEIEYMGIENKLMRFLEEFYHNDVPTITQINDLLWFDIDDDILRWTPVKNKEQVKDELEEAGKIFEEEEFNNIDINDFDTIGEIMDELGIN